MQYTLKKSLGQHFLKDASICIKIKEALLEQEIAQLLEVGPGGGALTQHIYDIPTKDFKAIELDTEKVNFLLHTYPELQGKLINADFLEMNIPFSDEFVVVGNFPYNISTQIVFKVLDWKLQVPVMIGMFQKEVAERIAAKPNSKAYGILSVLAQAFYDVTYLFDVPPAAFNPPPKVDSAVRRIIIFPPLKVIPPNSTSAMFTPRHRQTANYAVARPLPVVFVSLVFFFQVRVYRECYSSDVPWVYQAEWLISHKPQHP